MHETPCLRLLCLLAAWMAPGFSAAQAAGDERKLDQGFIESRLTGEYLDHQNGHRIWISRDSLTRVIFQGATKANDPLRGLVVQRVIGTALTLTPRTDEESVRALLGKLREMGVVTSCTTKPIQYLSANGAARAAILRIPGASGEETLDMQMLPADKWTATYIAFRSKELARVGALPFGDERESALGKTLPLDDLPFGAMNIIHRVSGATAPTINWCLK
jgi:hypothetical protein